MKLRDGEAFSTKRCADSCNLPALQGKDALRDRREMEKISSRWLMDVLKKAVDSEDLGAEM